ncbi:tRNA (adenosine(37)-N6)-threonylcarbamoyltransferase complex dimerization subunit type 1 TsaB [Gilvimarinus sp. DA14]|uniref:tRNA (adenosine(37)-N6)-threonylcarbamoyltransferase complex dimerization subunit type 1 TsaB n=1 Tax=Gilvimarinus sp. DA14 TaxID=2956798 RepID=UPI0020B70A53|nr:tRNA (adenosine(37)-N6)-threonylcarbamoyltransferase complex dimerization subunit type 1 TsaB [Gilvimarinus sp. DA14]UTF60834.1 tRNA (adenosine(37)-N6)-threonylcarbamoyltransferase complex dimerization subunit type 1 TsaB [Gilvimarinus sp. DA14]
MTKLLALDTSGDACSVALWHDGQVRENFELAAQSHTQRALPMIDELLEQAGITLQQIDALAIGAGPGSFTGLRIGMGVIQGLAFACDKPVIAVCTLEALAWQALLDNPDANVVLPALDARMGEVYWGLYRRADPDRLTELSPPAATDPSQVAAALPELGEPILGAGGGWKLQPLQACAARYDSDALPRAAAVVELAIQRWREGQMQDALTVQPKYVRDTVSWKKRERIRS